MKGALPSDKDWPAATAIAANAGMDVGPRLRPILVKAIELLKADCIFLSSFPDYPYRAPYLRKLLITAAQTLGDNKVTQRIRDDDRFFKRFKSVVSVFLLLVFLIISPFISLKTDSLTSVESSSHS